MSDPDKEFWYEWRVWKKDFLNWRWEVSKVYGSGLALLDGRGTASTKFLARHRANKHFERRTSPRKPKNAHLETGRF